MALDISLLNHLPTWNQSVENHLKKMPFYLQQENMKAHKKNLHIQPGIEINISHTGKAAVVVGENIFMQAPRQLILIPGNVPHQVFPIGVDRTVYKRSVICLDDKRLSADVVNELSSLIDLNRFSRNNFKLTNERYMRIKYILQMMDDEMCRKSIGWQRMILSHLLELTVILQRSCALNEQYDDVKLPHENKPLNLVLLCSRYVQSHLYEDLSLKRVATLFSISPEHLTRSFRKEKGIPYYQYVKLQRVLEAQKLLRIKNEMTITDIAFSLGFTSSSRFSEAFKSITQMTPTEYRQQLNDGFDGHFYI